MDPQSTSARDGRTTRWAGHRDRRRAEFVEAAIDVIDSVGPNASVEQIASAAGVTRQVLYRHFDGRADLDRAIVERAAALIYELVINDLDGIDDLASTARRVLEGYLDFVEQHRSLYWFSRAEQSGESNPVDEVKGRLAETATVLGHELVAERGTEPALPIDAIFASGLVGLVDASISHWLRQPGTTTREQLVDGLALVLVAGIDAAIPPA